MSKKALNRRTMLRGMLATGAAVTVPLPLLDAMLNTNGNALAQGEALAPLYATWFFGNGSLPGLWKPSSTGAGSAWQLSHQLEPLADVKSHLTVISGLQGRLVDGAIPHPSGSAAATIGAPLNGNAVTAASIDQVVADMTAAGAPFRSIEVGVTPATPNGNEHTLHSVSHNGPNARNEPEYDPKTVFNRLFGGNVMLPDSGEDAEDQSAKLAAVQASVLDSVQQDGVRLQQRLGAADRARLDAHLESIRAIEQRLEAMPSGEDPSAVCGDVQQPSVGADERSEAPPEVNTAMAELSTLALACEMTRVLTFTFSLPAAHVYYRHLADMNDDFHDTICHGDPGDDASQPRVDTGVLYAMRCLNEFLTKMNSIQHGASTLLDASLVYVTSDTAWGKIHTSEEWPVLLAGKANGRLRGDEHHNFPGENLTAALLTVAQLMGSTKTEFGSGNGHVTSALSGIQV